MVLTNEILNTNIKKNIYENTISFAQFRRIFTKGARIDKNYSTFQKICYGERFNTKYFSSRLIIFCFLYSDKFNLPIINILNKEETIEFSNEALAVLGNYGRYTYYRELNDDRIAIPDTILSEFSKCFTTSTGINTDYSFGGVCEDTSKLINYVKGGEPYIIYETLKGKTITDFHYDKARLTFAYEKKYKIID